MPMTDAEALAAVDQAVRDGDHEALDRIAADLDHQDELKRARLERPEALAEAARWYVTQGVPVFPLVPRLKTPLTTRGFYDATTDLEQVNRWWAHTPQANIGMPTGTVADVIDVDGPTGVASIAPYVDSIRAVAIGIVSTPRPGGLHYYVPPAGHRKNSASKFLPGVDTRATGGYVVLPPSVTDEHGPNRRYTWLRPIALELPGGDAA